MSYKRSFSTALIFTSFAGWTIIYAQPPMFNVVVEPARIMEAPASMALVASVAANRSSRVGTQIAGLIKEFPAREGDFVEQGQVLCKLDDQSLVYRLAEAHARLDALKAVHEELLNGTRPEDLKRLKALLGEATAEYEAWQFEMKRVDSLFESKQANTKELIETRSRFRVAERKKVAAEAGYDLGVAGPRTEQIARAKYDVAEQQSVVDRIQHDLEQSTLRAPFKGYVVQRHTEQGEWLAIGAPVLTLVDLETVLVRVDVPESAILFIAEGDTAHVLVDALGRSAEGTVKHIIRQADPRARTFPVEIEVDNENHSLYAGMFARATVASGPAEKVVAVPKDAIVERSGTSFLGVVIPGREGQLNGMLMPVTVGVDIGDWVSMTSNNVQPGMPTIVRGNENMQPFPMPVQTVDEQGTPVAMPEMPPHSGMGSHPGKNPPPENEPLSRENTLSGKNTGV